MKANLFDRVMAVIFALDGQIYAAPSGLRLEVTNIGRIRILLRVIFFIGFVAIGAFLLVHRPLLAVASGFAMALLVLAAVFFMPSIKASSAEQQP